MINTYSIKSLKSNIVIYNNGISKKQHAIDMLSKFKNEDGSQKESSIEESIRLILESINVFFTQEYPLNAIINGQKFYKVYDFLVTDGIFYKFLIEAHGDYYHYYNHQINGESLSNGTKLQKQNVKNDEIKKQLAKKCGIPLMVFWERDIKTNIKSVKDEIEMMINRSF